MKIVNARIIDIPTNLPELLDKRAGKREGTLRGIIADNGKAREADKEAFKMALALEIKQIMTTKELPSSKPMTEARFCEMMWVVSLGYIIGTITIDESGGVDLGRISDIGFVSDLLDADRFKFRNGKTIPAAALMPVIQHLTDKDAVGDIYKDVAKRGFITRKEIETDHAMLLAETIMQSGDRLAAADFWDK